MLSNAWWIDCLALLCFLGGKESKEPLTCSCDKIVYCTFSFQQKKAIMQIKSKTLSVVAGNNWIKFLILFARIRMEIINQ